MRPRVAEQPLGARCGGQDLLALGCGSPQAMAPAGVEIWHQGRYVARHARSYERHQEILDLEHCVDVLEHKPGAFAGSKPLEQCDALDAGRSATTSTGKH